MIHPIITFVGTDPLKATSMVVGLGVVAIWPHEYLVVRAIVAGALTYLSYQAMHYLNRKFPPSPGQQASFLAMSFFAAATQMDLVKDKLSPAQKKKLEEYIYVQHAKFKAEKNNPSVRPLDRKSLAQMKSRTS